MPASAWLVLGCVAALVAGTHVFLAWWSRRPGQDPEYRLQPGQPYGLPGERRLWQRLAGISYASPVAVFIVLTNSGHLDPGRTAFWALAVLVATQLLLFAGAILSWRVTRTRRRTNGLSEENSPT